MWVRKTAAEEKADRGKFYLRVCLEALALALLLLVYTIGGERRSIPAALRVASAVLAGFILLGWYQRERRKGLRSEVSICERCNAVGMADGRTNCDCGGMFQPLRNMKWDESPAVPLTPVSQNPSGVLN
jgi:hypothetical protein